MLTSQDTSSSSSSSASQVNHLISNATKTLKNNQSKEENDHLKEIYSLDEQKVAMWEELDYPNEQLKTAPEKYDRELVAQITKFDNKENSLEERLNKIDNKKLDLTRANLDAADDDLMEINAGGKIIAAKRSTLT